MDLPPARSGLFLEVSFLRLLRSCEEIIAGDDKGRADLEDWATSPVFHHVRPAKLLGILRGLQVGMQVHGVFA